MTNLPDKSETVIPVPLARRVNEICDRFEAQWQAAARTGNRPHIETYLAETTEPERSALLRELVLLDADYRRLAAESPRAEDYASRFPELDPTWLTTALLDRRAGDAGPASLPGAGHAADAPTVVQTEPRGGQDEAPDMPAAVGGYRLLRRLGGGGMGTVFEAEETASGRRVAVKFLAPELADSPEAIARFRAEGRLASGISHPRCVFVLAADEDAGRPYIVMELMPGDTLADLVKRNGPLPPQQAVAYILDIIEGLQEAHRAGVIHRDVKPSNCFLSADGRVKIGDFGLAKSLAPGAHLTRSRTFLGTPLFASPEQIKAQPVDPRTDIYSVAATLYYLLAGKAPFEGGDGVAVMARIVSDPPPPLRGERPDVSPGLERIILRGLERDRERRPQSLEDLRVALLPFSPQPSGGGRPAWRFAAHMLDGLLFVLVGPDSVVFALLVAWGFVAHAEDPQAKQIYFLVWNGLWIAYFTVLEGLWGWSLGKMLFGLRVCRVGGSDPPGLARALARTTTHFAMVYLVASIFQLVAYAYPDEWWWWIGAIVPTVLGALLLLTTMRRANGYRAPHDLLCDTTVVVLPSAESANLLACVPPSRLLPSTAIPPEAPERLGPFAVQGVLCWTPDQKLLLGMDPALGRAVWIELRERTATPLSASRRELHRTGRLRWLGGGPHAQWQWDALLAPSGMPVTELAASGPLAWHQARPLLEQLANEMAAASADGTLPASLTPEQVWVRDGGSVLLLDAPPVEVADTSRTPEGRVEPSFTPPAPSAATDAGPLELLRRVAILLLDRGGPAPKTRPRLLVRLLLSALTIGLATAAAVVRGDAPEVALLLLAAAGVTALALAKAIRARLAFARRELIRSPLPGHADELLARLLGVRGAYSTLQEFRASLDATSDRPARTTRKLRLAHLATLGTLLLPGVFVMILFARSANVMAINVLNEHIAAGEKALRLLDAGNFRNFVYADMGQSTVRKVPLLEQPGFVQWKRDQIVEHFSDPKVRRDLASMLQQQRRELALRLENISLLEESYAGKDLAESKRLQSAGHGVDLNRFELVDFLRVATDAERMASHPEQRPVDRLQRNDVGIGPAMLCVVLLWPVCWVMWSFLWRGGLTHRFLGLILVLASGHRALRAQCAWRTFVVWFPVCVLASVSVWLEAYYPEWARWSWACLGAGAVILLGLAGLALRWPSRGLQDRLAGTYLVPR
jgi:eukaryotic-like serine/threonine-protein kinase